MSTYSHCMKDRVLLSIGVLFLLFLVSCSAPLWNATSHKTYTYAHFNSTAAGTMHPGDRITLTWSATPSSDSNEATPAHITLNAVLFGPLSSPTATGDRPSCLATPRNVVAEATPIQTDDWTNTTETSVLLLPQNLPPGYYVWVQKAGNESVCTWGKGVIMVTAK